MSEICVSDGRKRSGWFWLDNQVFDMGLDPYEFFVYAFLVRIADRGSEIARISTRNLAKKLGISRQRAINAIRKLEKLNMIRVKPQQGKNGNRQANMYILTSQEEWVVYQKDQGWSTRKTRVVYEIDQGGLRDRPGVVYEIDHPPEKEGGETLERQGDNGSGEKASRIYNIKNLYINNHHHQNKGENGKVDDGGARKEKTLVSREDNTTTNTDGDHFPGSGKNNSRSIKPSASLRENSAAGKLAGAEPQQIYKGLRAKWDKHLKDIELERLTIAQAIFFLENSALSPEQTLEAILRDDRNPNIKNPVGTLYSTLPLKGENYRWLLKFRTVEDEEWFKLYIHKVDEIKEVCRKISLKWMPEQIPSDVKEAKSILQHAKKRVVKAIWSAMSDDEKKHIKHIAKQGSQGKKDLEKYMVESMVLDKYRIQSALFDI